MVGIISVVIGGHFGGRDHFDGGDHFGGGTRCPSYRESNKGSKERQGPTPSVRFTEVSVKRESTVNADDGRETARRLGREQREGFFKFFRAASPLSSVSSAPDKTAILRRLNIASVSTGLRIV